MYPACSTLLSVVVSHVMHDSCLQVSYTDNWQLRLVKPMESAQHYLSILQEVVLLH